MTKPGAGLDGVRGMLCLVVEYTGEDVDFPSFTRAQRGSTVDLLVEPAGATAPWHSMLVLVRGAPPGALDRFVELMQRTRAPVETLRHAPAEGLWFGRVQVRPGTLDAPSARALASLQGIVGPPWIHVESGVVHARARLVDPMHPDDVLQLAETAMRGAGIDAQMAIQEVSPRDHSVWEDLVRHSIGLSL